MKELFRKIQPYSGKIFAFVVISFFSFLAYNLYNAPVEGLDEKFVYLLKRYGYIILFAWGMLEGEAGLIMAGLLSHTGDMNLYLAIFIAGLGGFAGDKNGMVKTPTLRNITETAPYFHNGAIWTLKDAIKEMGSTQLGISITDAESDKIETFLKALKGRKPAITYPQLPESSSKTPKPDSKM